jgi:hypothetical protein
MLLYQYHVSAQLGKHIFDVYKTWVKSHVNELKREYDLREATEIVSKSKSPYSRKVISSIAVRRWSRTEKRFHTVYSSCIQYEDGTSMVGINLEFLPKKKREKLLEIINSLLREKR